MKVDFRIPERRKTERLRTNQLASYTRYEASGTSCEEVIARLTDASLGGVRLQSSSPARLGERLDITLVLGNNLVSFRGKTTHMAPSQDGGFDLGISIDGIEDEQRICLIRLLSRLVQC